MFLFQKFCNAEIDIQIWHDDQKTFVT